MYGMIKNNEREEQEVKKKQHIRARGPTENGIRKNEFLGPPNGEDVLLIFLS